MIKQTGKGELLECPSKLNEKNIVTCKVGSLKPNEEIKIHITVTVLPGKLSKFLYYIYILIHTYIIYHYKYSWFNNLPVARTYGGYVISDENYVHRILISRTGKDELKKNITFESEVSIFEERHIIKSK